jgi:hypothetical protein
MCVQGSAPGNSRHFTLLRPPKFCLWELATFRSVATAQLRLRAFLKPSSGDVCVPFIFNVVKTFRVQRRLRATQRQNEAIREPIDGRQCRGYNCGLWGGDTYSERCTICRIDCACSCVIRPATIYVGTPVVHQLCRCSRFLAVYMHHNFPDLLVE